MTTIHATTSSHALLERGGVRKKFTLTEDLSLLRPSFLQ